MGREIERKYLVLPGVWSPPADGGVDCLQGYVPGPTTCVVRVRLMGDDAFLTLKAGLSDVTRAEYEYAIPPDEAREMLDLLCPDGRVHKTRYTIYEGGAEWVVDVFHGANDGLVLAEIELEYEDEAINLPVWIGREVTSDSRYRNSYIAYHPFSEW